MFAAGVVLMELRAGRLLGSLEATHTARAEGCVLLGQLVSQLMLVDDPGQRAPAAVCQQHAFFVEPQPAAAEMRIWAERVLLPSRVLQLHNMLLGTESESEVAEVLEDAREQGEQWGSVMRVGRFGNVALVQFSSVSICSEARVGLLGHLYDGMPVVAYFGSLDDFEN